MKTTISDHTRAAKELRATFLARHEESIARVIASHPKGSQLAKAGKMTHLDAKVTVARETGALNWQSLEAQILDRDFAIAIEHLDLRMVKSCLKKDPTLMKREIPSVDGSFATPPLSYVANVSLSLEHNGPTAKVASAMLDTGLVDEERLGYAMDQACSLGAEDVALILIEAGADVSQSTIFDATALHWAVTNGMPKVVEALVRGGANLEHRCTNWGGTPLWWGVRPVSTGPFRDLGDPVAAIRKIIELGADIHAKSNDGRSVHDMSRRHADMSDLMDEYF
ncbi:MAG: ankyrin repeat domain-containing protein [Pseudomonadota bacterium]